MLDAVVVENPLHFRQSSFFQEVIQIGVPEAKTFEAGFGCRFNSIPEVERTVLVVGVREGAACNRPVRSEQFDVFVHWRSAGTAAPGKVAQSRVDRTDLNGSDLARDASSRERSNNPLCPPESGRFAALRSGIHN